MQTKKWIGAGVAVGVLLCAVALLVAALPMLRVLWMGLFPQAPASVEAPVTAAVVHKSAQATSSGYAPVAAAKTRSMVAAPSEASTADLNAIIAAHTNIASASARVGDLLGKINTQYSATGQLSDVAGLIAQTKTALRDERALGAGMSAALDRLAADAAQEANAEPRAKFAEVVLRGRAFVGALNAYVSDMDSALSPTATPSAAQEASIQSAAADLKVKTADFNTSLQDMITAFGVNVVGA